LARVADGVRALIPAFAALGSASIGSATEAASRAARTQSRIEKTYRRAMSALIAVPDLREVAAKRELYRRFARASDELRDVAERVWYSALKES
jgi:hypothetical protein